MKIILNMKLKNFFKILIQVNLVSFILVTFGCDSNNGATGIKQKEEIILDLYSTPINGVDGVKIAIFRKKLCRLDTHLGRSALPRYDSMCRLIADEPKIQISSYDICTDFLL